MDKTEKKTGKMKNYGNLRTHDSTSPYGTSQCKVGSKRGVSTCQMCEQHELEYKKRLTEMNEKLNEYSYALRQKEEELQSFKDRLAAEVAVSIKTGNTESMNNPVSKSRLTDMYQKLKLLCWPKTKDDLKSNGVTLQFTKTLMKKMFRDAADEMERKKTHIEEVFGLIELNSGLTPQKVKQFSQLAIHNLQLSLYQQNKEELLRTPFIEHEAQYSQEVTVKLRLLASECYWLGCLLFLNNPPLQPDWENHVPGMDPWDILPRDLKNQ